MLKTIRDYLASHQPYRFLLKSLNNVFMPQQSVSDDSRHISIEVSSICDARCVFCAYQFGYRKKTQMSVSNFEQVAQSCVSMGYTSLDLTSMGGELLTHKDALQIIEVAKLVGFSHIGFFTNGIRLKKYDTKRLLNSGVDAILISFPGFDREVYKMIYGVDRYYNFEDSVKKLLAAHAELNSKVYLRFEPRTFLTKQQIEESRFYQDIFSKNINEFISMQEPLRVFDTWGGEIKKEHLVKGMRLDIAPIKHIPRIKMPFLCRNLHEVAIHANGDVRLCNCRYDRTIETESDGLFIDNLSKHDWNVEKLLAINKQKISQIKSDFAAGNLPSVCQRCPFYVPVKVVS